MTTKGVLKKYKINLKNKFQNRYYISKFDEIFKRYENENSLKGFAFSTLNFNPNLKLHYFKFINSKEKAYWLGWIYAEGHINKKNRLQIEISIKDEILVLRFADAIGFERSNIVYKERVRNNGKKLKTVLLSFKNNSFINYLLNKGLKKGKKAECINLPNLGNFNKKQIQRFYLAFLLGYFDGDGTEGTSMITSISYNFFTKSRNCLNLIQKLVRKNILHLREW